MSGIIFRIFEYKFKLKRMKKLIVFFGIIAVVATFSAQAQSFKYTVKASADCTNRTVKFTVPTGKVAKLMQMDIIPSWNSCNESQLAPTSNWARVTESNPTTRAKSKIYYKKTVDAAGHVTESVPIQDVKLNPGTYTLEISKAQSAEATLTIFLAAN